MNKVYTIFPYDDRKHRHDAGKLVSKLQIGDRVYIRNRGLKSRDKIQDKWKPEVHVYVIVGKPYESVYCVKFENRDAGERNVNRMELKPVFT